MYKYIIAFGLLFSTAFALNVEEKTQSFFSDNGNPYAGGLYMSSVEYNPYRSTGVPYRAYKKVVTQSDTIYVLNSLDDDTKKWVINHETAHPKFYTLSIDDQHTWKREFRRRGRWCATRYGTSSYGECFAEVYACLLSGKCPNNTYSNGKKDSDSFQWRFVYNLNK